MKYFIVAIICFAMSDIQAQNENDVFPYSEIPVYPENYGAGNVIARMIDGLGYRFYWATEGLREEDLKYKPSEDSRQTDETIEHLFGLSEMIVNAAKDEPNIRPSVSTGMNFNDFRKGTLNNLKKASEIMMNKTESEISDLQVKFQRGDNTNSFPLWNLLNGPLSDALYHTGQVVAFRRASGNPINSKVNVFMGKNRD
ncbi:MAG: hypothetical protein JXR07_15465 [Reichenbachiella sp.]